MEISRNNAFSTGVSTLQTGLNRVDQAAGQIASASVDRSVTSQSSDTQVDRLRSVDRSQQSNLTSHLVDMSQGKLQAELGIKLAKASDEMLGKLIDTYA